MLTAQGLPASVPEGYSGLNDMPRTRPLKEACTSAGTRVSAFLGEIDTLNDNLCHLALPEKSVFETIPTLHLVFCNLLMGVTGKLKLKLLFILFHPQYLGLTKMAVIEEWNILYVRQMANWKPMGSQQIWLEEYHHRVVNFDTNVAGNVNTNQRDFDFTRADEQIVI